MVGGGVGEREPEVGTHAPQVQRLDLSVDVEGVVITRGGFSGGLEERGPEAQGGGSGGGEEERTLEASPMRQPRSNLGKDPVVVEEVEEQETPAVFVGSGTGAGSSRHIGMGDFFETATIADLAESLRGQPGLAEALLEIREAELWAEVEAEVGEEPRAEEEGEEVPRRTMVDEVVAVLGGRGAYKEATYVPLRHAVVPSLLDAYRPKRPT